jgi:hypothetical protein
MRRESAPGDIAVARRAANLLIEPTESGSEDRVCDEEDRLRVIKQNSFS